MARKLPKKWIEPVDFFNLTDEPLRKRKKIDRNKTTSAIGIKESVQTDSIDLTTDRDLSGKVLVDLVPTNKSELAVHQKKIEEMEQWFELMEKSERSNRILLISGPTGSGKTITLTILARERNYEVSEWITQTDIDQFYHNSNQVFDDQNTFVESQFDKLQQFLFRSSRYRSLFEPDKRKLILIEDFPNVLIHSPEKFEKTLEHYKIYGKSPLIFIVSETTNKHLNIAYNLFTDTIKLRFQIDHITFNACATTLLRKCLQRTISWMKQSDNMNNYTIPTSETLESIILGSLGDIRNAVINLKFSAQKNAMALESEFSLPPPSSNGQKSKFKQKKLKSIGRDETLTTIHALGRVLHPKYQPIKPDEKHLVFHYSPEDIADSFLTQPQSFVNLIHTNYLGHFSTIDTIVSAVDSMSFSDVLMNRYSDPLNGIGVTVAIRSIMVYNEQPQWKPIRGKYRTEIEGKRIVKPDLDYLLPNNVYVTDYRMFANIITRK